MSNNLLKSKILFLIQQRTSEHPISSVDLWEELLNQGYVEPKDKATFGGMVLRPIISELRQEGNPVLADTTGYYWATNPEEIIEYVGKLTHRWLEIKRVSDGLKKIIPKDRFSRELFQKEARNV